MAINLIKKITYVLIAIQAAAILIFGYAFLTVYGLIDQWPIGLSPFKFLYPVAVAIGAISLITAAISLRRSKLTALLNLIIFLTVISCAGSYYLYSQNFVTAYFEIAEEETMRGNFLGMKKGASADVTGISGIAVKAEELRYEYSKGTINKVGQLTIQLDNGTGNIAQVVLDEKGIVIKDARFHLTGNYGYAAELEVVKEAQERINGSLSSEEMTGINQPISGGVFFPPFLKDPSTIETNFLLPGSDRKYLINLLANEAIFDAQRQWTFKIPAKPELKLAYVGDDGFEERTVAIGGSIKLEGYNVRFAALKRWAGVEVVKDPYFKEAGTFFWLLLVSYAVLLVSYAGSAIFANRTSIIAKDR